MTISDADLREVFRLLTMGRKIETELSSHPQLAGYHAAIGEEATIVGAFYGLRRSDVIVPHYRGGILASYIHGADLRKMIAGAFLKATAYNMSRFRGDICYPAELNIVGFFTGILGSTLGLATGAAMAQKQKHTDNVVVVTFGEGTSNLGACHENMNMAACLNLPVVFVCQNNQYAISTNYRKAMKCSSIVDRAQGYGIPGARVDGNNVIDVMTTVQEAVAHAREGNGPTLIEALTYRISGHFAADPAKYQNEQERQSWMARDPIGILKESLPDRVQTNESVIDAAIDQEFTSAFEQALSDPAPDERALGLDSVFAPSAA